MFVSKLLNRLFFNTNNECYFKTLTNLNQFMLTKNNYQAILDSEEPDSINTTMVSEPSDNSINDADLLERKRQNQRLSPRCITPVPFSTSSPETPENLFRPIEPSPPLPDPIEPLSADNVVETPYSGAYSPKQQDTLFWCLFIIAYGYGEYVNIGRNYGVKELEVKQKVGSFVANRDFVKYHTNYKITRAMQQEIHSELLTSQKDTSFPCLLILCCYFKINVVLVHANEKLMLEFICGTDEEIPYYILRKDTYGKYSVDTDKKTWKDIQELKTRLICIDNYMKPMKAAGNYKIEDLEGLAQKMGVLDASKKYKKTELYHLVCEHLNWYRIS